MRLLIILALAAWLAVPLAAGAGQLIVGALLFGGTIAAGAVAGLRYLAAVDRFIESHTERE